MSVRMRTTGDTQNINLADLQKASASTKWWTEFSLKPGLASKASIAVQGIPLSGTVYNVMCNSFAVGSSSAVAYLTIAGDPYTLTIGFTKDSSGAGVGKYPLTLAAVVTPET